MGRGPFADRSEPGSNAIDEFPSIAILIGGDGIPMNTDGQVLGHFAVNLDGVDGSLFEGIAKGSQFFV